MTLFSTSTNSPHRKLVIGMIHLQPLPGSPRFDGNLDGIRDAMLQDADALADGGVHALLIENFGDAPFFPQSVPPHVIAHMTSLACDVRRRIGLPLGINVLRNDGQAALAVAHACGADFIRVNVLCGARVTDQGLIEGIAHHLLRQRAALDAEDIDILADVAVKHSAPLAERPLEEEVADTIHRGRADAIIVTGSATGVAVNSERLRQARAAGGRTPLLIGSGVSAATVADLQNVADGFIVGTAFKKDAITTGRVDAQRVKAFMRQVI